MYSWQHKDWPNFTFDSQVIEEFIPPFSEMAGKMAGVLEGLKIKEQQEALIRFMISEAITTSEIEGEMLSRQDVMSSIKNNLGINLKPEPVRDKKAKAVSELLINVRNSYDEKLSEGLIKSWHELLFHGVKGITIGKWRTGEEPMQVVSGTIGKEIVHFEAPPSVAVPSEMKQFVKWYNSYKVNGDFTHAVLKTAIAHLYFETIHPFEDGNGRIGRAIAEKCLAESLNRTVLMSLSSVISKNRAQYYNALKKAQHTLAINEWLIYFAKTLLLAQKEAVETVSFTLKKSRFFEEVKSQLNDRELKVIKKLLDAGVEGFEGGMTAKKYMSITRASKATATRDLQHLVEIEVLIPSGGGRSVSYTLNL